MWVSLQLEDKVVTLYANLYVNRCQGMRSLWEDISHAFLAMNLWLTSESLNNVENVFDVGATQHPHGSFLEPSKQNAHGRLLFPDKC